MPGANDVSTSATTAMRIVFAVIPTSVAVGFSSAVGLAANAVLVPVVTSTTTAMTPTHRTFLTIPPWIREPARGGHRGGSRGESDRAGARYQDFMLSTADPAIRSFSRRALCHAAVDDTVAALG
jgi:hypothetical protein